MRTNIYQEIYNLEKDYWWHVGRRKLVFDILKNYFGKRNNYKIMDFGCGTGMIMSKLQKYGNVLGIDNSAEAIKFCKARGLKNLKKIKDIKDINLTTNSFDFIITMDTLEHIEDESLILEKFNRLLKKKGKLLVTVPAYQFLWSYWDEISHHKRRYTIKNLKARLEENGFKILKISYFYSFILPITIIFRLIRNMIPATKNTSDLIKLPKFINSFLVGLSDIEIKILKSIKQIPFGLSIICLAERQKFKTSRR